MGGSKYMGTPIKNGVSDKLLEAMLDSGKTLYQISKESGLAIAALSRFTRGKQGVTIWTIDRLADALNLTLVPNTRAKPTPKAPKKAKAK